MSDTLAKGVPRIILMARDVVRSDPDLIMAINTALVLDLKAATTTIPIVGVFALPVETGIVPNLPRPGGNPQRSPIRPTVNRFAG